MSGFIASNGQDLHQIFYPLVPGATQVTANTKFLSGSVDLKYIFRSVVDGSPAPFNTGFVIGGGADLKDVFAVIGSVTTPTPTGTVTPTPTPTPTYTPTVTPDPAPDFGFDAIYSTAACKCDDNNGLTIKFTAQASTTLDITVGFGDVSESYPTLISGDMVQDFIIGPRQVDLGAHTWVNVGTVDDYGWNDVDNISYFDMNYDPNVSNPTNTLNLSAVYSYNYTLDNVDWEGSTYQVGVNWVKWVWTSTYSYVNNKSYTVTVGPGEHTITVAPRTFDVRIVDILINRVSGPQFTTASVKTLINPLNSTQLSVSGISLSSQYHYHVRNATENTENLDSGVVTTAASATSITVPWTGAQVNPFSIAYIELKGAYIPFNTPTYPPTTQDPVDTAGMYTFPVAYQVQFSEIQVFDGRVVFYNDANSFCGFEWNTGTVDISAATGNAKGYMVGGFMDLAGDPIGSGGSAPHTQYIFYTNFTMNRDQAPTYTFSASEWFSSPGVKANSWLTSVCFFRDRNNPGYGWFQRANTGGAGYPFNHYAGIWEGTAESVTLYRYESPPESMYFTDHYFWLSQRGVPYFNRNATQQFRIYGHLPMDFNSNGNFGGRIKSSSYRNNVMFISQIH